MAIYNGDGTIFLDIGEDPTYSDTACVNAFLEAMNAKAVSIGMTNSNFIRAAGDGANQTTPKDMVLLTLIASSYKELSEIWSKNSYSCTPRNSGASKVSFNTTVKDTTLESSYPILGGKTGHLGGANETSALACICDVDGKQVAGYIHGLGSIDRFGAMKQLMDIANTILSGGTNTNTVDKADEAIAVLVPTYFTANYEQQPMNVLYAQNENNVIVPASTTKILTALTVLDWISDINDTFTFVQSDMIGGSGAVFSVGDIVSFKDALYALMLPSSNQSAQAMARVVGRKMLTRGI